MSISEPTGVLELSVVEGELYGPVEEEAVKYYPHTNLLISIVVYYTCEDELNYLR